MMPENFISIHRDASMEIWVYHHSYVTCSSAVYTAFDKFSKNVRTTYKEPIWCDKDDHSFLQAFYEDNRGLLQYYKRRKNESDSYIVEQISLLEHLETTGKCPPKLNNTTEALMYYTEGRPAMLANQYHEDAWWKRLCGAIQKIYPHLEVTHTAERAMKFPVAQEKSSGLPCEHVSCYLFRGSSDITVTHRPRHRSVTYRPIVCAATTSTEESSDDSSAEELIEVKHQADPQTYKIPPHWASGRLDCIEVNYRHPEYCHVRCNMTPSM